MVSKFSALLNIDEWGEEDDFGRATIHATVLNNSSAANPGNDRLGVVVELSSDLTNGAFLVTDDQTIYQMWRCLTLEEHRQLMVADIRPARLSTALINEIRLSASDGLASKC
jgi:hypothetical protein